MKVAVVVVGEALLEVLQVLLQVLEEVLLSLKQPLGQPVCAAVVSWHVALRIPKQKSTSHRVYEYICFTLS